MEKKIPYISRNYDDYKSALIDLSKIYYPDMDFNFNDASVGSWFIDLNAAIADELSYHIDRAYQETNINSARKSSSLFTMARNMGFKVPGPKGAMCEVAFRCILPLNVNGSTQKEPDWNYAPIIKRGTKVASNSQTFELMEELNFRKQFSENGVSNRLIQPVRDSNRNIISYIITKFAVVVAGETNIYKKYVSSGDITPFMEILIPAENVMNIESIIVKEGSSFQNNPTNGEFYMPEETDPNRPGTTRFFEVDSLSQQQRWDAKTENNLPVTYEFGYVNDDNTITPSYSVTKGEWKVVNHKFVTEFTDNGYLKVTFGAGVEDSNIEGGLPYSQYQMSKMMRNDNLGYLPKSDTTIFILYRAGGGKSSNLPKGAINTISYLDADICDLTNTTPEMRGRVKTSITVESTTESVSGKDMPTADELKHLIKYSVAAQNRCVTIKDYVSRVLQMPAKYGTPFRVGGAEENNKVVLYTLGINNQGKLDDSLPLVLVENIQDYLSRYRMVNDFIEIKPGRIINIKFEPYVIIDKDYNVSDVITSIKQTVMKYMDVNKHDMGEDIYVGDISREISNVDGVINLIRMKVYNVYDSNHSQTRTNQALVSTTGSCDGNDSGQFEDEIDLETSDGILYSDGDCMLEVKDTATDIVVQYKQR